MMINFYFGTTLFFCVPSFFFFNDTATTDIYTLSLHDALPISRRWCSPPGGARGARWRGWTAARSEEHTSELQSRVDLVCRLLLETKKENKHETHRVFKKKEKRKQQVGQYPA